MDQTASHSEENQAVNEALAAFDLLQDETGEQEQEQDEQSDVQDDPAIDQPEPRMIKVKHNKEEVEVDVSDDKLPEYVQKALALDKERAKKTEYEKNLDRVAKLNGFQDHADLIANLDRIEQEAQKREQDQFNELRQRMRTEYEEAGLDPAHLDQWLESHPLIKQAQQALIERQRVELEGKMVQTQQQINRQWNELYSTFPELVESSRVFNEGGTPEWFTSEMQSMVQQGYHPLHAYKLAHIDKITAQTKKQAEQKAIKDQRLGLRAQTESGSADLEPEVPDSLSSAFALFGLPKDAAKKYVKK